MSLRGVPSENKTLLLVKAAIADPKLIDEFLVLISKNTGIPQYEITVDDIKQAVSILASSDFWSSVRSMGVGAKYNKVPRQSKPRKIRPSTPESSDSDSSSSSGSGGGLDLGFSEDEAQPSPPKPAAKKKIAKKKKPDSDVEMASPGNHAASSSSDSSESSSSDSSSSDSDSSSSSSGSSSSDSSVESASAPEIKTTAGKEKRKKKQSGFVARRRAEQAEQAEPREVPTIPKFAPKLSASTPSSDQSSSSSSSSPTSSPMSSPDQPSVSPDQPPASRKVRRPANWHNENSPPSNTSKPPSPKKLRTETNVPSVSAPSSPVPDWASDYGRLVRQAIDNRRVCPFRTLGLPLSSTMAEVKKRWAKLCLLLHPDKAPAEWKSVPELVDANQAINDAKKTIEQRMQATALSRPQKPSMHVNPFTVDRGNFGKRRIEIRWNPSQITSSRERVEKYIVFLLQQSPRTMVNAGSVREGTDPFFVLVEDDQRFAKFFQNQSVTVSVLANNGAGNSDPLTIVIPLK